MNHHWHVRYEHPESDWISQDFVYLECCDMLIRIKPIVNGKEVPSLGADAEEKKARELGMPVFTLIQLHQFVN